MDRKRTAFCVHPALCVTHYKMTTPFSGVVIINDHYIVHSLYPTVHCEMQWMAIDQSNISHHALHHGSQL